MFKVILAIVCCVVFVITNVSYGIANTYPKPDANVHVATNLLCPNLTLDLPYWHIVKRVDTELPGLYQHMELHAIYALPIGYDSYWTDERMIDSNWFATIPLPAPSFGLFYQANQVFSIDLSLIAPIIVKPESTKFRYWDDRQYLFVPTVVSSVIFSLPKKDISIFVTGGVGGAVNSQNKIDPIWVGGITIKGNLPWPFD